ncbi:MAG: hypothetical protein R6V01_05285 [Thermoplasmatota archaeon]
MNNIEEHRGSRPIKRARPLFHQCTNGKARMNGPATEPLSDGKGKAVLIIILITVNIIGAAAAQDESQISQVQSADYGIFSSMETLHAEQELRDDDAQVRSEVDNAFSSMDPTEYMFRDLGSAGFVQEDMEVPPAITKSPVVFDAVSENPIIDDVSILDWALPPPLSDQGVLNYLILTESGGHITWSLGSMVPRIGLVVDSSLDKWVEIDVDGLASTGDSSGKDIRARMTFGRDILERDWEVSLFPPTLNFNDAGLRIQVEALETQNGMSAVGGSVHFIKGISFDNKNYIWSVGVDLDNFMDSFTLRVKARQWKAGPDVGLISQLLSTGSVNLNDLNMLEILGPYTVSYEFRTPPEDMALSLSVLRVFDQVVEDKAYIELGIINDQFHERIVENGMLSLNVESFGDPIDRLEWIAGVNGSDVDDTVRFEIRYVEFGRDLVDAYVSIPIMPSYLKLEIEYPTEEEEGSTVLDLTTENGLSQIELLEVIYQNWTGREGLGDRSITSVRLKGIPGDVHIETTAGVPQEEKDTSTLNILDSFMSQLAGRFYRIGEILREIPRAVTEMPGRKGSTVLDCRGDAIFSMDYVQTSGLYLNSTGNFAAFLDHGTDMPGVSAHLEGLSYYSGSFSDGSDITLELDEVQNMRILARSPDATALVSIDEMPSILRVSISDENISYRGSDGEGPAEIGSISYSYRDPELFFDVNVYDIPSSLSMVRSADQVQVRSGSGAVGTVELFTGNSTSLMPFNLPERNFVSVRKETDEVGVGIRLNRFRSLTYNNGTDGFLEISTVTSANFYALIDDTDSGLYMEAVFAPLPPFTHIETPSVLDAPELGIPDVLGIESISDYSEVLLALSQIGRAPLVMASGIARGLTETIGQYSAGFSISWDLAEEESNLDLFIRIEKKGEHDIEPARWTHGIWIEQEGTGMNSSLNSNIYLKGMPTKGEVSLSFSSRTILVYMDFGRYMPDHDWMLVRTTGVQDRDITVYLTGLEDGMDFRLSLNITTDLAIGGQMDIDMDVEMNDQQGRPLDLGPMIAALRKGSPILSVRQMYLPRVPSDMHLQASVGQGVVAEYSASRGIDHMYFKITKLMDGRWSQIYAIFHDLPTFFSLTLTPNTDFTVQEPFPLQGLPLLDLVTSSNEMDIFIEYDGSGFGQRGRYKMYADDIGNTSTYYRDSDYIIESDGIGFLSLELERLPAMEGFTLSSLMILGNDLERLRLGVDMGFGIYPVISLTEAEGGSFQIKMEAELEANDDTYTPDLFFLNFRTDNILGLDVITGVSVNKDNSAVNMDSNDGGIIMPAPVLTFWGLLIDEVV